MGVDRWFEHQDDLLEERIQDRINEAIVEWEAQANRAEYKLDELEKYIKYHKIYEAYPRLLEIIQG